MPPGSVCLPQFTGTQRCAVGTHVLPYVRLPLCVFACVTHALSLFLLLGVSGPPIHPHPFSDLTLMFANACCVAMVTLGFFKVVVVGGGCSANNRVIGTSHGLSLPATGSQHPGLCAED